MRRLLLTLALLPFAATALPGPAVAQGVVARSVVVLVPEAEASREALGAARAAAIEVLAERGIRLVRVPDGPVCADAECAATIAQQTGADFVALVSVEATGDGGEAVRIRAVPAVGAPTEAREPLADAGVGAASAAALTRVLEAGAGDPRGFLVVRSDPPGASVAIDGEAAGRTPLRVMATPGEHAVRVLRDGRPAHRETVTVTSRAETRVTVGGDPEETEGRAATDAPPAATEPSELNFLIGGGLAVGGVIALVSPLSTLAQDGQCVEEIENVGCVEQVRIGPQTGVLLGVGIAALIAAVVVDVVAPIRVDVAASTNGRSSEVRVRVEGNF